MGGRECEIVEMSSRISTVDLVSRSKIGPGVGMNSSSSSLVADPEQIGALCRRVDEAKGFNSAWRLDFGVAETSCFDEFFLIVGTGYNTGFSSSAGWGWESKRIRNG